MRLNILQTNGINILKINLLSGGVLMLSRDKKITLLNDLESRMNLAFEQDLPSIKRSLFQGAATKK